MPGGWGEAGGTPARAGPLNGVTTGRLRSGPREHILEMLERAPGLNIDEIAARLGMRRTAANHHLRILLRTAAIVRVRQAGHQLHFTTSTGRFEREALCALRVPSVHDVARRLQEGDSPSSGRLASVLNITGRTARRALRLLTSRGLLSVERLPDGQRVAHLHPALRILIAHEERPASDPPRGESLGAPSNPPFEQSP